MSPSSWMLLSHLWMGSVTSASQICCWDFKIKGKFFCFLQPPPRAPFCVVFHISREAEEEGRRVLGLAIPGFPGPICPLHFLLLMTRHCHSRHTLFIFEVEAGHFFPSVLLIVHFLRGRESLYWKCLYLYSFHLRAYFSCCSAVQCFDISHLFLEGILPPRCLAFIHSLTH